MPAAFGWQGCHSQGCGLALSNTKIVGGQDATPGSWPWLVSLNNNKDVHCAGSLITYQWVLTAAHCVTSDPKKLKVYLGRHSQSGPKRDEVMRRIREVIIHPSYVSLTNDNDIALVSLSSPAPTTSIGTIYPACLAATNSTFHTGISSWVAGWGATANATTSNILQEVNLPIVGNNECKCAHRGLTKNMICAGLKAGGKDSCKGDSGAPLVTRNGPVWVQSGIVSFGDGCGKPMSPGVYTRVSEYEQWIRNVTGESQPGFIKFTSSGVDSDLNFICPASVPITTTTTTTIPAVTIANIATNSTAAQPIDGRDDSVFDGGENVICFTHFTSLCALVLSLCALVSNV